MFEGRRGWMIAGALLLAFVLVHAGAAWGTPAFDLSALIIGGRVLADSGFTHLYEHDPVYYNLASSPAFTEAARALGFGETPTPFVHSPLVAVSCRPLASLPYGVVTRAWLVFGTIATVLGLSAGARMFAPTLRGPKAITLVLAALLLFEPIRYGLALGQTTPFIFALTMGGLYLASRDKPLPAGTLLALAAFVKLTPIVFLLPWIATRRWRALAAFGATFALLALTSLAVAGPGPNLAYIERVRAIGRITVVAFNNHSLPPFLERFGRTATEFVIVPVSSVTRAVVALGGLTMLALGAWAIRPLAGDQRERLVACLSVCLLLALPTLSWTHYFVLLVPVGLALWELDSRRIVRGLLVLALLLLSRPLAMDHVAIERGPVALIIGPTLAVALVYALVIAVARRRSQSGITQPL